MPKGYCNIKFVDGPLDGDVDEIQSKLLAKEIVYDTGSFYLENSDGSMTIVSGKRKPTINWVSFNVHVYAKQPKSRDIYPYKYMGLRQVERCHEKTQKGTRCGHQAINGEQFCTTHKKPY